MTKQVSKNSDNHAREIWTKLEHKAAASGASTLEYMVETGGEDMRQLMLKLIKHEIAHRAGCPPDCKLVSSLNTLKEKYSGA